jgi:hypothetical protein
MHILNFDRYYQIALHKAIPSLHSQPFPHTHTNSGYFQSLLKIDRYFNVGFLNL